MASLRDKVMHQTIDADCGQEESDEREETEERGTEAALRGLLAEFALHGGDSELRHRLIYGLNLVAHRRRDHQWIGCRANDYIHFVHRVLIVRTEYLWRDLLFDALAPHVSYHAN